MKTTVFYVAKNIFLGEDLKERKMKFNKIAEKYLNFMKNLHIEKNIKEEKAGE